jgi:hypothetical protein
MCSGGGIEKGVHARLLFYILDIVEKRREISCCTAAK